MAETPRHRWFQFSLRTTFVLTALVAISTFAILEHRQRMQLEEMVERLNYDMPDYRSEQPHWTVLPDDNSKPLAIESIPPL